MNQNEIYFDFQIPVKAQYLTNFLLSNHGPKCFEPIKLQDSFISIEDE